MKQESLIRALGAQTSGALLMETSTLMVGRGPRGRYIFAGGRFVDRYVFNEIYDRL